MQLRRVVVRNYRRLNECILDLGDYTVLVGANGTGKSSLLRALNWFFRGGTEVPISDEDLPHGWESADRPVVEVEVTFDDLDDADRAVLGRYVSGESATFRRSWDGTTDKVTADALAFPEFAAVRAALADKKIADAKSLYHALPVELGLPKISKGGEAEQHLKAWEDAHPDQLEPMPGEDATHLFASTGEHLLSSRFEMVLIPAAVDFDAEAVMGKKSALAKVLGSLGGIDRALQMEWDERRAEILKEIGPAFRDAMNAKLGPVQKRINERLAKLVPGARLELTPEALQLSLEAPSRVTARIVDDGVPTDLTRQGHGTQRAVLMAIIQATGRFDVEDRPAVLLAFEEPEIYQHPLRAKHFAAELRDLANGTARVQVALTTHSPAFARPDDFHCVRRFESGEIRAVQGTKTNSDDARQLRQTSGLSEAFFADAACLVEGSTDHAVIRGLLQREGLTLEALDIAVVEVAKGSMRKAYKVLSKLGLRTYAVFDGDAGIGLRTTADSCKDGQSLEQRRAERLGSAKKATEHLLEAFPGATLVWGSEPQFDGGHAVTSDFTVFHDRLEEVLSEWDGCVERIDHHRREQGGGEKNAACYELAVMDLETSPPDVLVQLVSRIKALGPTPEAA